MAHGEPILGCHLGIFLVTDIETGLYVLEPKYTNASFVEGVVTDSDTGLPISNAQIQILGTSTTVNTDLGGYFETGVAVDGTYELLISSSGYADYVQTVVLNSGQIINLDTQLSSIRIIQYTAISCECVKSYWSLSGFSSYIKRTS